MPVRTRCKHARVKAGTYWLDRKGARGRCALPYDGMGCRTDTVTRARGLVASGTGSLPELGSQTNQFCTCQACESGTDRASRMRVLRFRDILRRATDSRHCIGLTGKSAYFMLET